MIFAKAFKYETMKVREETQTFLGHHRFSNQTEHTNYTIIWSCLQSGSSHWTIWAIQQLNHTIIKQNILDFWPNSVLKNIQF